MMEVVLSSRIKNKIYSFFESLDLKDFSNEFTNIILDILKIIKIKNSSSISENELKITTNFINSDINSINDIISTLTDKKINKYYNINFKIKEEESYYDITIQFEIITVNKHIKVGLSQKSGKVSGYIHYKSCKNDKKERIIINFEAS